MTADKQNLDDDAIDYRNQLSPFTINMSLGLQMRIRMAAQQNDLSVDEYVERILDQAVPDERSLRLKAVERLRQLREKIMRDRNGELFEDSTEMIRQMREERSRYLEEL